MPTQRNTKEQLTLQATDHHNSYAAYDRGVANATRFFKEVVFKHAPEDNLPATRSTENDTKAFMYATWPGLIADTARKHIGSEDWSKNSLKKHPTLFNEYKCNAFVSDIMDECGIPLEHVRSDTWGKRPPLAGDWADTNQNISGWSILKSSEKPLPGDVVAISRQGPNYSGHVGIVTGTGKTTSAGSDSIFENDWGFRPDQKNTAVFRRYNGKSKP